MIRIAMTRYEDRGLIACVCTTSGLSLSFECNVDVRLLCRCSLWRIAAAAVMRLRRHFATDWCHRPKTTTRTARAARQLHWSGRCVFCFLNPEIIFVPWRLLVSAARFIVARILCIFSIFSPFYIFSVVPRWCNTRRSIAAEMHVMICGLDEIVLLLFSMLITWNVESCVWNCGLWPW